MKTSNEMIRDAYTRARRRTPVMMNVSWTADGILFLDEPGKHGSIKNLERMQRLSRPYVSKALTDQLFGGTLPLTPHGGDVTITSERRSP